MLTFALVLGAIAAVRGAWVGERRNKQHRRRVFDACAAELGAQVSYASDGFPRLSARADGKPYHLALIPDSLTIKRLPQLWLSLSMPLRSDHPKIAVTARPRLDDFFSAATGLRHRIEPPGWLPEDLAIRSDVAAVEPWLAERREALCAAFADPLVKEVAVGPSGLRLVYRLAEGDRGRHLLLRQSIFEATLTLDQFRRLRRLLRAFEPSAHHNLERAA